MVDDPERICDVKSANRHRGPTDGFRDIRHVIESRQGLACNRHGGRARLQYVELGNERRYLNSPSPAASPEVSDHRIYIESSGWQGREVLSKRLVQAVMAPALVLLEAGPLFTEMVDGRAIEIRCWTLQRFRHGRRVPDDPERRLRQRCHKDGHDRSLRLF